MTSALLFLVALAIALRAARAGGTPRPERVPGRLWRAGALLVVLHALREAGHAGWGPAADAWLRGGRAVAGLALWLELAELAWYGPRTRAVVVRWVFGGVALLVALVRAPAGAVVVVSLPAVLSFGWRRAIGTRARFATALGGIAALAIVLFARVPGGSEPAPAGATAKGLATFADWAGGVAFAYVLFGVGKTLAAFVSDPTLGIRTIRRRLALSHLLVGGVPFVLLAVLWTFTTWLGVGADRALAARHAFEAQAEELRGALAQAVRSPGDPAAAVAAVAAARTGEWPHARAWWLERGALRRVAGTPVPGEQALPAWAAGLDSLRASGVVALANHRWLGACVRDPARGAAAIALVPVGEALAGMPSRVAGVRVLLPDSLPAPVLAQQEAARTTLRAAAHSDSLQIARARAQLRRLGLPDSVLKPGPVPATGLVNVSINEGADTVDVVGGRSGGGAGATGAAELSGISYATGAWTRDAFTLRVPLGFRETLTGMVRNARGNAYGLVPLLVLAGLVLLLLPVALFNLTLVRQLGRSFLQPVGALRRGTQALAEARLDYRIPLQGDDELWDAAGAFNRMSEGLARARALEKERDRLEHELDLARRIQQRLLPAGPPAVAGLEIAGTSEPAREVGGDYYDHIPLGDGRVLLVIADVSGKGVPAALLMSAFRAALMGQDAAHAGPAEMAERLNAFLHRSVDPGKFVTAFVGFLDGRSGRFVYANAGHNPPALRRRGGEVEWLAAGGLILGILPETRFESGEARLEPGDVLALYTDGVTEGARADGEQFGEQRLVEALGRLAERPCREIAAALVREVRTFEGEQGPADDITVLVARRGEA